MKNPMKKENLLEILILNFILIAILTILTYELLG